MPTQKKDPYKTVKSKSLPKKTFRTLSSSRIKISKIKSIKTAGSPDHSPSKTQSSPRENSQKTSSQKTSSQKTSSQKTSSQKTSKIISRAEIPSIKLNNLPDELLVTMLNKLDLKELMNIYSTNNFFARKNLVFELKTLDLTKTIINKSIITFLDKNLDKTKVNILILNDVKFKDDNCFNSFIKILKNFVNIEELQICRFWSKQYIKKNTFFIDLIKNIRYLLNLKILAIKSIYIDEEIMYNNKNFFVTFLKTFEKLAEHKLERFIFEHNEMSPDTSIDIYSGVILREDDGNIIRIPGIKDKYYKDKKIIIQDSINYTKKESGH